MGQVIQFGKRRPKEGPPRRLLPPERRPSSKKLYRGSRPWLSLILGGTVLGGLIASEFGPPLVGCSVKGNISRNTGERIYHVPGQEHYWETRINWLQGERWFCSENAARTAGWRRARS